ncbi:MAG: helix-turn-helix transcriptional regulator [Clostridia bacterium]|nr:helix-turn-helix transcriptional regulator [Clostridia bacterium]
MIPKRIISHDADSVNANEGFARLMLRDADIVKPILKEKLLKDYILGKGDPEESFRLYCDAFGTRSDKPVRVIVHSAGECISQELSLYLMQETERIFCDKEIFIETVILGKVLIILEDMPDAQIKARLSEVVSDHDAEGGILSIYSETIPIIDIPGACERLNNCLKYSFYVGSLGVMCENEIQTGKECALLIPKYMSIERAISTGDERKTKTLLAEFYFEVEQCMPPPAVAKTYCLELYVCMIRFCRAEQIESYMKGLSSIQNSNSLDEIKEFINKKALEIIDVNKPKELKVSSALVKDTLRIIDRNIGNDLLSLRWIAKNHLFTNVDYLGKVFKKEVGTSFSHYVMEKRMELAKKLIMGGEKDRIYEVAERVGYGTNSQYFSQVFKKHTGLSPLEYKESVRPAANQ